MFTGIIEELGRVHEVEKRGEDARIVIEARAGQSRTLRHSRDATGRPSGSGTR